MSTLTRLHYSWTVMHARVSLQNNFVHSTPLALCLRRCSFTKGVLCYECCSCLYISFCHFYVHSLAFFSKFCLITFRLHSQLLNVIIYHSRNIATGAFFCAKGLTCTFVLFIFPCSSTSANETLKYQSEKGAELQTENRNLDLQLKECSETSM